MSWPGRRIIINGALYTIATVASPTALTLTSSAGTHTGVSFTGSSVYNGGTGKPDMQAVFQNFINNTNGAVTTADGWVTFLNYYLWMQQCADVQIGRILGALSSPDFPGADRTIVMLHSDHGDYGGSHSLKAKGGALYDESLNSPLYISFPRQRSGLGVAARLPFVCSSVDILPFFYAMALGSDYYWRQNPCDVIAYLNKRESIMDGIYSSQPKQYRLSGIANQNGAYNGQPSQPFILHTTDEFPFAVIGNPLAPVQSHAVAFRTVDLTVARTNGDGATVSGGGKLGVYSFWPAPTWPGVSAQTRPAQGQPQQFEFYDYTGTGNLGETGNEYTTNPNVTAFVNAYQQAGQGELYALNQYPWPANLQNAYNAALQAYLYSVSVCGNGAPSADL